MSELGTCLDSESIGAFADGALRGQALAEVSEHLLTCDECLSAVGAANRAIAELGTASMGTDERMEPTAFRPRRWSGWWMSTAAAIAATAVIGLWLPIHNSVERKLGTIPAALAGKNRLFGPRMTGIPYGPYDPSRGVEDDGTLISVQAAASKVLERPRTSAVDRQAAGIADLVFNHRDEAIELLEQSAKEKPTASVYSDLAGAYYQAGKYPNAQQNADAALKLDPKYPPALFNRALVIEQLHPQQSRDAIKAWNAYLAVDKDSPWAGDAHKHIARLTESP